MGHFPFVALELPWELGPPDGRYVVRGHAGAPAHVLILQTLGTTRRRAWPRRRSRRAPPEPAPAPVVVTRATVLGAEPFADDDAAHAWLGTIDAREQADAAVAVLNAILQAHRIASADPFVREVALRQALAVRVGIGRGEEVAHGRWTDAVVLAPVGGRRTDGRGGRRLVALLAARDVALAAEELTLRARLDLDRGRTREAALQLRVALDAALAELEAWADRADLAPALEQLRADRPAVAAAARRALEGGLEVEQIADVRRVLAELEATLAARVAGGPE